MPSAAQALPVVRVTNARFSRLRLHAGDIDCGPAHAAGDVGPFVLCLVLEGACRADVGGGGAAWLAAGDIGLFGRGLLRLDAQAGTLQAEVLRADLGCDAWSTGKLLDCLSRHVVLPLRAVEAGGWIEASLHHGAAQSGAVSPGRAATLARLGEALLAEVLPLCVPQHAGEPFGWLAAAGDRIVGQVLAAMQRNPDREWTVDALAREAGTSRSVLSERFQQRMGTSPMQYLAQLRLALAANLLATSEVPLVRIAEDVGYQTDTAFSRAFRRHYGVPPATWRRRHAGARGALDSFAG